SHFTYLSEKTLNHKVNRYLAKQRNAMNIEFQTFLFW
ncbi:MAG: hypothetical protein ACI843_002969, partial [Psychrobacter glaciei]